MKIAYKTYRKFENLFFFKDLQNLLFVLKLAFLSNLFKLLLQNKLQKKD